MNDTIRWGIVGTGGIAHRFAQALGRVEDATLAAVASRSKAAAERFGGEFNIPRRFASYEDMAAFDGIDAAYIATPHALHTPGAILMLRHGKAVLSEKPIAVNRPELDKMIAAAHAADRLLVEAMWARMVPGTQKLLELVAQGVIGQVRGIQATFSYDMRDEPKHHAFQPQYGGGSLLDVGCYALYFASWFAGAPVAEIRALADVGAKTRVDEQCAILLRHENNTLATLHSGMTCRRPSDGALFGDEGYITMARFYAPERFTLHRYDREQPEEFETPYIGNGFEEQIIAFNRCLREGRKESDLLPLAQSREIARQMDEIRRQVGVVYPQDGGEDDCASEE
ncbi:MAG: Gfo/Idh/MocA family oxidoreductase [Oscillospiraceae bacterium]|jgi:predicted dehydrogenase|nr:Gfo/Idh/MocA family oxidoreductase [Oscillospiraceae bacterium]